jgi:hypothetical protein
MNPFTFSLVYSTMFWSFLADQAVPKHTCGVLRRRSKHFQGFVTYCKQEPLSTPIRPLGPSRNSWKNCLRWWTRWEDIVSPPSILLLVEVRIRFLVENCFWANIVHAAEFYRYIAPTLIDNPPLDSPIMAEEIFGPLLPIITVGILNSELNFWWEWFLWKSADSWC